MFKKIGKHVYIFKHNNTIITMQSRGSNFIARYRNVTFIGAFIGHFYWEGEQWVQIHQHNIVFLNIHIKVTFQLHINGPFRI